MINSNNNLDLAINDISKTWENRSRVCHYNEHAAFQQIWYQDLLETIKSQALIVGQILDIGCSSGKFLKEQALEYPQVKFDGIDYSSQMIAAAKKGNGSQSNVRFFQGDAQQLEVIEGLKQRYNLIIAATVIHWIPDQVKALKSMYNKLTDGGQIIIRTFDQAFGTPYLDPAIAAIQRDAPDQLPPFALLSMADYMEFGHSLGVDHMEFKPTHVDVPLPSNLCQAKNRVLNWLKSWYEPKEINDKEAHMDRIAEDVLGQAQTRGQEKWLRFYFVDMIIKKKTSDKSV